jgi:hypothetical protein
MIDKSIAIGKWRAFLSALILISILASITFAQKRTGEEMLREVDDKYNSFTDATLTYRMTVKVSSGENRQMEFVMKQKGNQRLIRFTSPDTLKGMAFLTTGPGLLFGTMPGEARLTEFNAGNANQTIAGSDMILEDIYTTQYAPLYIARYGSRDPGALVLGLTVRQRQRRVYPSMEITLNRQTLIVSKIEAYDAQGNKKRTELLEDYARTKITGFMIPQKIRYINHDRSDLETELVLTSRQFNTGLSDDEFNTVSLQKK